MPVLTSAQQQVQDFQAWYSGQDDSGLNYLTSAQNEHVFKIQSESGDSQALQDFIAWISTAALQIGKGNAPPLAYLSEHILVGDNCTCDGSLARFALELAELVHKWHSDKKVVLAYLYSEKYDGAELGMYDILTLTSRVFRQTFAHYEACGGTTELYDAASAAVLEEQGDGDPIQYAQAPEDAQDVIVIN